jgi:nitroreductase
VTDLIELLRSRRSVRAFTTEAPPRELLLQLIEAAVTAPSASNKQPWRFLIVSERQRIDAMAAAVREAVERIASAVEPEAEAQFRAYGDYFTRFEAAPCVIVPLFRGLTLLSHLVGAELPQPDASAVAALERDSGLIGTSLAVQNLLLQAHALGLGASGMTGPLVAVEAIREILGVSPSWQVACLIPVGYPAETPSPTRRKPAEKVVRWID